MGVPYGYPKMNTVVIMENPIINDGLGVPHLSSDQTQLADDYTGQYTNSTTNQHNQYNGNILMHQGIPYQLTSMMGRPRVLNTVHLGVGNPGKNQGHSLRKICQNTLALNVCLMISVVQP